MLFITYAGVLVIGAILLLGDLLAGTGVVVTGISAAWLTFRGTRTIGRVVWVSPNTAGRRVDVRVSYETPAGTSQMYGKAPNPHMGQWITVWYHPNKPTKATILAHPRQYAALGIPMVLWAAVLGLGMVLGSSWYFVGTHKQLQLPVGGGASMMLAATIFGFGSVQRLIVMLRWRRMVVAEGKVLKYSDRAPVVGPGILVAFDSGGEEQEFWSRAGVVEVRVGDPVTVYFDPSNPATSGTVETVTDNRNIAVYAGVMAVILGGIALAGFIGGLTGAI